MEVTKVKINSYGGLKDKEINLKENINIIYGKNESGKSTLLNFIVNSFYGISKNKKGKEYSNYDKYIPWIGDEFSGKLEYKLDNKERFEIYRDFRKKNPKIFNEQGEDISKKFNIDKTKGNEFFYEQTKIDEELFLSTLVVGQQEVKLEKADQNMFIQKIANIVGTGEDNVSYKRAMDRINRRQLNEVGTQNSREKPINILQRNIEEQKEEKEELLKYENFKYELEENKNVINREVIELEDKLSYLKNIKKLKEIEKLENEKIDVKEKIKQENINKIDEIIEKQDEIRQKTKIKDEAKKRKKIINKLDVAIFIILIILNIIFVFSDISAIFRTVFSILLFTYIIVISVKAFLNNKKYRYVQEQQKKIKDKVELELITLENERRILEENNKLIDKEIIEIEQSLNLRINLEKQRNINNNLFKIQYIDEQFLDLENLNQEIENIQNRINSKKIQLHTLDLEKRNIEPKLENLSNLEEELAQNIEQMEKLENLNKSITLAKDVLIKAYDKMKNTIAPKFTNKLSKSISNITSGKYSNVRFNDDIGLIVELEDGNYIQASKLSVGTIDQLYLSLRLSMVEELSEEKMPIILDEVFAYFDDKRLENVLSYLYKRFGNRQIIIFTCTKREEKILDKLEIKYNLVNL